MSDFYMIAGRAEMLFDEVRADPNTGVVNVDIRLTTGLADSGEIRMRELPGVADSDAEAIVLQTGQKIVKMVDRDADQTDEPLDWFSTEKLLFDRWRGRTGIAGFERYRDFATYELLYVGIADERDSFDRVIASDHKKRLDILTNEMQRFATSRVTDEVYLFLFAVEPLFITTFDVEEDVTEDALSDMPVPAKQIVKDAERAFIKLMDPVYNDTKYKSYPKGKPNLKATGIDRYAYVIGEDITFDAPGGRMRGGWDPILGWSNAADAITVADGKLQFFRAGDLSEPAD
ncbi:hypothetical protein [Sphingosinicella sp. BN140058]|uniref:hypothetical protein n=1 Tax=Sphingosinicella sp. BN140058 TaxID=1892855 RepID=UPI00101183CD|nr:hypothetical protein [Sphingosinicella sp. BN140058]QAY80374.1 hypothetical protein ETR14_27425 [Sphingosinicella sp. BN140058]